MVFGRPNRYLSKVAGAQYIDVGHSVNTKCCAFLCLQLYRSHLLKTLQKHNQLAIYFSSYAFSGPVDIQIHLDREASTEVLATTIFGDLAGIACLPRSANFIVFMTTRNSDSTLGSAGRIRLKRDHAAQRPHGWWFAELDQRPRVLGRALEIRVQRKPMTQIKLSLRRSFR